MEMSSTGEILTYQKECTDQEEVVISILGQEYKIETRKKEDDPLLETRSGYIDCSIKLIVICDFVREKESLEDLEAYAKSTMRHEIIHAYLHESGLDESSNSNEAWATNEEMVDWFAIQSPKIFKTFKELDIL